MPYTARLRVRMLTPPEIADGYAVLAQIVGLGDVQIELQPEDPEPGRWVVFKMTSFATLEEATRAGKRLSDTAVLTGAIHRLGVDAGFSRSTASFSKEVREQIFANTGRDLRTETHGLMVYEEGTVQIVGISGYGKSSCKADALEINLSAQCAFSSALTDRQRTCAALLNDSLFARRSEAQLILRVSAVEALCDQSDIGPEHIEAYELIETYIRQQDVKPEILTTILRLLGYQKKQSIRSAYLAKFKSLISDDSAQRFDRLYQLRSKFVHDGRGRGDLGEASLEAFDLATELLQKDLRSQPD